MSDIDPVTAFLFGCLLGTAVTGLGAMWIVARWERNHRHDN